MNISIKRMHLPDPETDRHLKELTAACNLFDGTGYPAEVDGTFSRPDDNNLFLLYRDGRLFSFISLFATGPDEAELSLFTHPEHRRQGYIRRLLEEVEQELLRRGVKDALFVRDRNSLPGGAYLAVSGAVYEYAEFAMVHDRVLSPKPGMPENLLIRKAGSTDRESLIRLDEAGFGMDPEDANRYLDGVFGAEDRVMHIGLYGDQVVGAVSVVREPGKSYIHGLVVDPDFRGRGFGRALLLYKVRESLELSPEKAIELEVQTENAGALGLYLDCGFSIKTCFEYSRIPVSELSDPS